MVIRVVRLLVLGEPIFYDLECVKPTGCNVLSPTYLIIKYNKQVDTK